MMDMEETNNALVVEDGWVMHYSRRKERWVRSMPVAEYEARLASLEAISAAQTTEQAQQLLEQGQKDARKRRHEWHKDAG